MPTLGLRRLACAHRVSPEPTYADVHPVGGGFAPLTHTFTQLVERGLPLPHSNHRSCVRRCGLPLAIAGPHASNTR